MKLYLDNGYLDQKSILETADRNHISFIVEIGGRQVGKTYGCLKLMLERGNPFILMRRTATEQEFICNDINNPFTVFNDYTIGVKKDTKYSACITMYHEDSDPTYTGTILALSTVAKIRGFNGSAYTDLVFDEFIPENHVMKIKDEGDAFLNAYTTIAGAREENGLPPLRCWLLANPNTINSPILQALNISEKVEHMDLNDQEVSILPDRGIMIIRPSSEYIMSKRRRTALFRAIGTDSEFAGMALNNDFSYNDYSDIIKSVPIGEYRPVLRIGAYTIYKHRSRSVYYCTPFASGRAPHEYGTTDKDRMNIIRTYPHLRAAYVKKRMLFSSQECKAKILDMLF